MSIPFVILASENDPRVICFQQALRKQGLSEARFVSYLDFFDSVESLKQPLDQGCILRIESPGRDKNTHVKLLENGIAALKEAQQPFESEDSIHEAIEDKGKIIAPHQYYFGFTQAMLQVEALLERRPNVWVMNHPEDILLAFDKFRCQQHLKTHGISIPTPLEKVSSYQSLRQMMHNKKMPRVFIKLRHGSAASGIIALETNKKHIQIKTTIETVVNKQGKLVLYNTRKIQTSRDEVYIQRLIDTLCKMEVQVERWIPKAQVDGYNVDLRILMIAGKAQHKVLRMSHTPMTNLHLLNKRADADLLRKKMTTAAWDSLIDSCEKVASCFPKSLYIALDVVVSINLKHHFILEVNAFGDLLKGVTYNNLTPQEAEIIQLKNDHQYLAV